MVAPAKFPLEGAPPPRVPQPSRGAFLRIRSSNVPLFPQKPPHNTCCGDRGGEGNGIALSVEVRKAEVSGLEVPARLPGAPNTVSPVSFVVVYYYSFHAELKNDI